MPDEYDHVARGKLKLKTDSNKVSKKKKKKDKKKREKIASKLGEQMNKVKLEEQQAPVRTMTKAEQSFKKMQEKMVSQLVPNCDDCECIWRMDINHHEYVRVLLQKY